MKFSVSDFPIINSKSCVYLDSAATSLKPQSVIDAISEYYTHYSANVHRGMYSMSERATEEYESTRDVVATFINAQSSDEIIFTRNATEAINLVAYSLGREIVQEGDEIVTSVIEHHANFVPWQQLAFACGADFKVIDCDENGDLDIFTAGKVNLKGIITQKTKLVALQHVSNVLGTIHPIEDIIKEIRNQNPKTIIVVDAAQSVPHMSVDVQKLDCDFLAFSSHKMCGPTGVGVLWGKKNILETMQPFMFGGDMIDEVFIDRTTFAKVPHMFEAGTPHIAGVIGLKAAIAYLMKQDMPKLLSHEQMLASLLSKELHNTFGKKVEILGEHSRFPKVGVVSFTLKDCHPHDIAGILSEHSVCIRAGHHCAMPLHNRLHVKSSSRASMYMYSTEEDLSQFMKAIRAAYTLLTGETV